LAPGRGEAIIDASAIPDRLFDVTSAGILNLSRVTVFCGTPLTEFHGGGIRVQNGGRLDLSASAVLSNASFASGEGGGIYFESTGRGSIIDSVITINYANNMTAGVYLQAASSLEVADQVTVTRSIIAKNTASAGSSVQDVYAGANRAFNSGGGNRLGNGATGFTHDVNNDYIKPVGTTIHYIVTGVGDRFDGNPDPAFMSLRDAIYLTNMVGSPYAEEIWIPAWKFVLTRQRTTQTTDTDPSYGDLDIDQTLTIRGVTGATSVAWQSGARVDAVFDLLGDYDGDGITTPDNGFVEANDYVVFQNTQGSTTDLRADGNDDGIVDALDYNINNTLTTDW
jgi:hypothetical protein